MVTESARTRFDRICWALLNLKAFLQVWTQNRRTASLHFPKDGNISLGWVTFHCSPGAWGTLEENPGCSTDHWSCIMRKQGKRAPDIVKYPYLHRVLWISVDLGNLGYWDWKQVLGLFCIMANTSPLAEWRKGNMVQGPLQSPFLTETPPSVLAVGLNDLTHSCFCFFSPGVPE